MPQLTEKYRPRFFKDVVGQPRVVGRLSKDFENRNPQPFYLLMGPSGVGKTTIARIAVLYLNCLDSNEEGEPCLECENCLSILNGTFRELWEVNAADLNSVADARAYVNRLKHTVSRGCCRVVIMDEVQRMTDAAQQVWLKPLEDGYKNTVIFFCTTDPQKILKTIKTRSAGSGGYALTSPNPKDVVTLLNKIAESEGIEFTDEGLLTIAENATGSVREAVKSLSSFSEVGEVDPSLVEKAYMGIDRASVFKFFKLIYRKRKKDAYWTLVDWTREGLSADDAFGVVMEHTINLLTPQALKHEGWSGNEVREAEKQSGMYGDRLLGQMLQGLYEYDSLRKRGLSFRYSVLLRLLVSTLHLIVIEARGEGAPSRTQPEEPEEVEDKPKKKERRAKKADPKKSEPESRNVGAELAKLLGGQTRAGARGKVKALIWLTGRKLGAVADSEPQNRILNWYILTKDADEILEKKLSFDDALEAGLAKEIKREGK